MATITPEDLEEALLEEEKMQSEEVMKKAEIAFANQEIDKFSYAICLAMSPEGTEKRHGIELLV